VAYSETPARIQGVAPELGQHTEQTLLDLGYSWEDIERLHDAGVTSGRTGSSTSQ
jgi:crotonobetainyl-CoA:carnitine CoA-transferase CaiB-like acyl-CoA transferase